MSLFLSENGSNAPGLLWGKKRYELLVNGNSAPLEGNIEGAYGSPTRDSGEMSENPATDCVDTRGRWTTPHRVPKGFNLMSMISFLAGNCSQEVRLLTGQMACLRLINPDGTSLRHSTERQSASNAATRGTFQDEERGGRGRKRHDFREGGEWIHKQSGLSAAQHRQKGGEEQHLDGAHDAYADAERQSGAHENLDGPGKVNCADGEFSQSDLRHQAHVAGGDEEELGHQSLPKPDERQAATEQIASPADVHLVSGGGVLVHRVQKRLQVAAEISAFSDNSARIQSPKFSDQPVRRWSRDCNR